jgi:hypothetical protein
MELVMWIMVAILAGAASIVLIPVLVLGTWYVVMTVTLGLVDGIVWLLDQRWKPRIRSSFATSVPPKAIDVDNGKVLSTG